MCPLRIDLFTGNDPNGPIGIEFLPWIQNEWGEYRMSLKGNPYHLICRPAGITHYGYQVDWNTFEFVNEGIAPVEVKYKKQVLKSGIRHICYIESIIQTGKNEIVNYEIANFEIYEYGSNEIIPAMTISIEEEYQNKGYTKEMMKKMMNVLNEWPKDKLLYIDTDASCGFWKHIGMVDNINGNGYELVISVEKLMNYCL